MIDSWFISRAWGKMVCLDDQRFVGEDAAISHLAACGFTHAEAYDYIASLPLSPDVCANCWGEGIEKTNVKGRSYVRPCPSCRGKE